MERSYKQNRQLIEYNNQEFDDDNEFYYKSCYELLIDLLVHIIMILVTLIELLFNILFLFLNYLIVLISNIIDFCKNKN